MIFRTLALAAGLAGGLCSAQLPEFSQQYVQRLGGAVDSLTKVVADFDASATAAGLTREDALKEMAGTAFLERRRADMKRTFARHDVLTEQLNTLSNAGAGSRVVTILRAPDRELARATFAAFRPAMPVTSEGLLFGGSGFIATLLAVSGLGALFRGRRVA